MARMGEGGGRKWSGRIFSGTNIKEEINEIPIFHSPYWESKEKKYQFRVICKAPFFHEGGCCFVAPIGGAGALPGIGFHSFFFSFLMAFLSVCGIEGHRSATLPRFFRARKKVGRLESVVVRDRKESKNKESPPSSSSSSRLASPRLHCLTSYSPFYFSLFLLHLLFFVCVCFAVGLAGSKRERLQPAQASRQPSHTHRSPRRDVVIQMERERREAALRRAAAAPPPPPPPALVVYISRAKQIELPGNKRRRYTWGSVRNK